jgi:hypothetical protein
MNIWNILLIKIKIRIWILKVEECIILIRTLFWSSFQSWLCSVSLDEPLMIFITHMTKTHACGDSNIAYSSYSAYLSYNFLRYSEVNELGNPIFRYFISILSLIINFGIITFQVIFSERWFHLFFLYSDFDLKFFLLKIHRFRVDSIIGQLSLFFVHYVVRRFLLIRRLTLNLNNWKFSISNTRDSWFNFSQLKVEIW